MAYRDTVPAGGGRAFHFPSLLLVLLAGLGALFMSGCSGQAPIVIPPLSPELVAARFGLGTVRAFAWTSDGSSIVAGGDAGRLTIIDGATRRPRAIIAVDGAVRGLAVVSQSVVAGTDRGAVVRYPLDDIGFDKPAASLSTGSPVTSVAIDANATIAAVACENGQMLLWDMKSATAQATRSGVHTGGSRVAFSADGKTLYSGGDDGLVRAYALPALTDLKTSAAQGARLLSLATTADGKVVAGGDDGGVRLLDGKTLAVSVRYSDLHGPIYTVATSGPLLAAGSDEQKLAVWKIDTDSPGTMLSSAAIQSASGAIRACTFSPDGKSLAAAGDNRLILQHNLDTGAKTEPVIFGTPDSLRSLALSPDGKTVATVGSGPDVLLWDAATFSLSRVIAVKGMHGDAQAVAWSEQGLIATGNEDGSVCLVDPTSGKVVCGDYPADSKSPPQQVNDVAFSPDGHTLASGGWDRTVHLWAVAPASLKHSAALQGHGNGISAVAFSPDGALVASSSWDQTARTWDVKSGTEKMKFGGMSGPMFAVALGKRPALVVGGWHGQTWVWNPETGANDYRKDSQTDVVFRIALSHGGRWVASGSADHTVWLYDLEQGMSPQTPHIGDFRAPVRGIAWTPDDGRVFIGTSDGNLFELPSQIPGTDAPAPTLTPAATVSPAAVASPATAASPAAH